MNDPHRHGRPAVLRGSRYAPAPRWPVYVVVGLSLLVSLTLWVTLIGTVCAVFHNGP